jgi:hypothetical protein
MCGAFVITKHLMWKKFMAQLPTVRDNLATKRVEIYPTSDSGAYFVHYWIPINNPKKGRSPWLNATELCTRDRLTDAIDHAFKEMKEGIDK